MFNWCFSTYKRINNYSCYYCCYLHYRYCYIPATTTAAAVATELVSFATYFYYHIMIIPDYCYWCYYCYDYLMPLRPTSYFLLPTTTAAATATTNTGTSITNTTNTTAAATTITHY